MRLSAEGFGLIKGEVYSHETIDLFDRIKYWLRDFATLGRSFHLTIDVPYYNTSASKCFPELFELINTFHLEGSAEWHITIHVPSHEEDEDAADEWRDMLPDVYAFTTELIVKP